MLGWKGRRCDEVGAHGDGQREESVLLQLLDGGMLRTRAVHLKPLDLVPYAQRVVRVMGAAALLIQRQGSLAMASPCSSSSKQMAHSPESLDRMSSEEDNTHSLREEFPRTPNHTSDVQSLNPAPPPA
ncbi:hypothetical protein EYF80_050851 [Liparis tanakae]|uniref:Uncharacterized protein n=1 Tax=Liparis tanakae TaxID=230148 RepID=A0A4Z2FDL2_9TELE|nr:hypothetical protein EYF80_050851 [Liparis tanakae]